MPTKNIAIAEILEQIKSDPEALLQLNDAIKAQKAEIAEAKRAEREKAEAQRKEIADAIAAEMKTVKQVFKSLNKKYQVEKISFTISETGDIDTIVRSPLLRASRSGSSNGKPSVSFPRALENHGCNVERKDDGYTIVTPDGKRYSKVTNVASLIRKEKALYDLLTDYEKSAL